MRPESPSGWQPAVVTPPDLAAGVGTGSLSSLLTSAYTRQWERLTAAWTSAPGATLATLGPPGTSSHLAASLLVEPHGLRVQLFDDFDEVLAALLARQVQHALVPSAYRGATAFHWNADLRLEAHFAGSTPQYGIASRTGSLPPGSGPITVAAMWEVRPIYQDVVPPAARDRPVHWVDAVSTQHAAEILGAGGAEAAVTNQPGVTAQALRWVAHRPGAEIVWMLFSHR